VPTGLEIAENVFCTNFEGVVARDFTGKKRSGLEGAAFSIFTQHGLIQSIYIDLQGIGRVWILLQ